MGLIATILVGFIVGLVARFVKPGDDNLGFILTSVVGIIGAVVAAYLGQAFGWYLPGEPVGFIASVIGAILVLVALKATMGRK